MSLDWRVLIAITVMSWTAYTVILKTVAAKVQWQASMLLFILSYALVGVTFCLVRSDAGAFKVQRLVALWPVVAGLLCGLGAITFFAALPKASGSVLIPLAGLYIPLAAVGCLLLLREPVSLRVVLGIACGGAAVLLLGR